MRRVSGRWVIVVRDLHAVAKQLDQFIAVADRPGAVGEEFGDVCRIGVLTDRMPPDTDPDTVAGPAVGEALVHRCDQVLGLCDPPAEFIGDATEHEPGEHIVLALGQRGPTLFCTDSEVGEHTCRGGVATRAGQAHHMAPDSTVCSMSS